MKNVINRALAAKKKNYIAPQSEITSVTHSVALCSGSGSNNNMTIGGGTDENNITEGY